MKRKHRAIMLVELLLGMLIAAGVVMILGLIMTRLFAVNVQAKEHQQFLANLGRLSQQFRRDVHAAAGASLATEADGNMKPAEDKLSLSMGPRTVIYSLAASGVQRAVSEGDAAVARDLFALPGFRPLSLKLDEHRREVELTIGRLAHPTGPTDEVSGKFSILAVLRDRPKAAEKQP